MRVRYETGVATLIQFSAATLLTFISGVVAVINGCIGHNSGDCISNTFVSLLYIILTIMALGVLAGLGYVTQERRSSRLAQVLIACEAFAILIYLFDAKHAPGIADRITNFLSFLLAAWVILVAWRLMRAKGGRIVVKAQTRRRPAAKP